MCDRPPRRATKSHNAGTRRSAGVTSRAPILRRVFVQRVGISEDAVPVSTNAGQRGGPDDWGGDRVEGGEVARRAARDQPAPGSAKNQPAKAG